MSSKPKKIHTIPEAEVSLDQDKLIKPEYGSMTNDYYFSRTGKEKWDDEEFDRWFTEPDEKTIKLLEEANDSVVDEITGAAP